MASTELDLSSGVPLYRQIRDILRREVTDGAVDTEHPMTEAELLVRFGVSRAPIRQALKELADEGYVYRRQGKGTFPVVGNRIQRPADVRLGALYEYLADRGLHPSSTVTGVARVNPPPRIRQRLGVPEHERLLHFTRLIRLEETPLARAELYIRAPEDFRPTAAELEETGSALDMLERGYGISLERAEHEASATAATADQAATLGVSEGSPLLAIETVFLATGGLPVGWRSTLHKADEFSFQFVTSR